MKVVANLMCIARINYNLKFLSVRFGGAVAQSFVFIYVCAVFSLYLFFSMIYLKLEPKKMRLAIAQQLQLCVQQTVNEAHDIVCMLCALRITTEIFEIAIPIYYCSAGREERAAAAISSMPPIHFSFALFVGCIYK